MCPYIDDEKKAYFEYGKKALVESIDIIKNFIQMMIPLTTGLITAYFALLKFLGIETALKSQTGSWPLVEPAVILLVSLGAFIAASFPVPYPLAIEDLRSITDYRRAAIIWKYSGTIIGSVLFVYAMTKIIFIVMDIIGKV